MKEILKVNEVPVVDYYHFYVEDYERNQEKILQKVKETIEFPVIVKPVSLGSSVGISKASTDIELKEAIEEASKYDIRILVESAIVNLKEINCSILGDFIDMQASPLEEVLGADSILSFKDKYMSNSKTKQPNSQT